MRENDTENHNGQEEIIKQLCTANGLSYEKIAEDGSAITSLEVFFSGYPCMVGLHLFPFLCQLTIVGQKIKYIEGLECCALLKELWVVECKLTDISGLENCIRLQKLYLYNNQITKIENLEFHTDLMVLWLNNNDISHIEGLNTLQNLKELNLADNHIEKIGHSLDPNVSLQNLNLSGNKISSFKPPFAEVVFVKCNNFSVYRELTHLAQLPQLTELRLMDPQSSPNPVCLLSNYATHILYHMPGLQRLDVYDISIKQVKEAAESTVMKKMIYYNMQVRTAQRNLAETQSGLLERKAALSQLPEERVTAINYALKNLELELSEMRTNSRMPARTGEEGTSSGSNTPADSSQDHSLEQKIARKIEALLERLAVWNKRLAEIEAWCEEELSRAKNRKEFMVNLLLMELETVGNIRFEAGCPTDPWFTSCADLLLSRFSADDFKAYGITGITINRIIRIHNRALRLRFEDKLHALLARESAWFLQNYKRWMEYLFYDADSERTSANNETLYILEEGFQTAEEYKAFGREGAVPLSNSLRVTEQPRIEFALRSANQGCSKQTTTAATITTTDSVPFRHGQIIVSKVFLGRSVPVQECNPVDVSSYPKAHSVYRNVDTGHIKKAPKESSSSAKAHSGCEVSPSQIQWFVFDHELVLPEYLIDFEYISQEAPVVCMDLSDPSPDDVRLDLELLNMEPVLSPRPRMLDLDEKTLLSVARANMLRQITVLNLHGNSLNKLKEISRLPELRHLTVSFNQITRLDDISHMPNLEFVDASYNQVETLEGLQGLGRLKQLDLCWNRLSKPREMAEVLRRHTPALLILDIRHNPWHRPERVRRTILGHLVKLTHLDNELVAEEEVAAAAQMDADSSINQDSLLAHCQTASERPRSLSLLPIAQFLCQLSPAPWDLTGDPEPGWTSKITALNLDSQGIVRLPNLDKLVNLRWASFNDNEISNVEGLESCLRLEELCLEDNCITTTDALSKLHCLTKLNLNGNQLHYVEASVLEKLPHLHFLSVEKNSITSLNGIQRARSLIELCISNNNICTTREIYYLKGLTNLIILDLYGNPLVERLENYRIYVVFQLPSLKALDGVAVEATESENAKDVFGGRLSPDMVAEKLGHSNYSDITELNLHGCSIRMVDLAPTNLFQNLCTLNLEHNNLTSFSGLIYLPSIKVLCLNYNHIESILPRPRTQTHLTNRQMLHQKVISSGYGQQFASKGNRESDSLEPLMASLEVLHLSHNGISNMANLQLSRLTNLKALFLQGNGISQIDGLEGLFQLRELALDRNRIKALGENSFKSQAALLELHLAGNRIRELSHLEPLANLSRLYLDTNKLQEIVELEKLEVVPLLTELSVVGNPVARRSLHRAPIVLRLPRLQILDGVLVTLEERARAELLYTDPSCTGPPVSLVEANLSGLLPLMTRSAPLRGPCVGPGLHSLLGHDITLASTLDEPHDASRYRRPKCNNPARGGPSEVTCRHSRRGGGGTVSDGSKVAFTYSSLEQDSRFQYDGAHKPPPM